jgi:alanyl-tRNA synthetase
VEKLPSTSSHDTATVLVLGVQQVAVSDMSRNEARDAIHVTDQPIEEGQAVTAVVDWDRRFDHMQQHTGP